MDLARVGVGLVVSVPLAVGISALEIIVILVQAYVFTLLSAVFIGMANARGHFFVLTLRVDPLRLLFVKREILGPGQFELLRSWLQKRRLLG